MSKKVIYTTDDTSVNAEKIDGSSRKVRKYQIPIYRMIALIWRTNEVEQNEVPGMGNNCMKGDIRKIAIGNGLEKRGFDR